MKIKFEKFKDINLVFRKEKKNNKVDQSFFDTATKLIYE